MALIQPLQGAGDGFGFGRAQQSESQAEEFVPGPGIRDGQGGGGQERAHLVQEGRVHEGREKRSKVLGAVRQ